MTIERKYSTSNMVTKEIERVTMTAKETAAYLGISKDLVYSMVKAGELPAVKIGKRVLFRKDTLDRWMNAQELHASTAAINQSYSDSPNLSAIFKQ